MHPLRLKLAMKIGGEYGLRSIARRHWQRLATETRLNADELLTHIEAKLAVMPDSILATRQRVRGEGLTHPIIDRLSEKLHARVKECRRLLR
jgi:serine/threonine-protein kinase HipA